MPVINRLSIGGASSGDASLNIFTQIDEPETKDGIWIKTNNKCSKILSNAFVSSNSEQAYISDIVSPGDYRNSRFQYCNGKLHSIVSSFNDGIGAYHYTYDGSSWTLEGNLPYPYQHTSFAPLNNYLIMYHMAYPTTSSTYLNDICSLDTNTNTFSVLHSEVAIDGYWSDPVYKYKNAIYTVIMNVYTPTNVKVTYYKVTISGISEVPSILLFYGGRTTEYNGCLYGTINNTMYISHDNSTMEAVATFPSDISIMYLAAYNNYIYVFSRNIYRFDPSNNTYIKLDSTAPSDGNVCPNDYLTSLYNNNVLLYAYKNNICLFGKKPMDPNALVIYFNSNENAKYNTAIVDTSSLTNNNNRFLLGFDDVKLYDSNSNLDTSPIYYGDGTQWIKFKN